MVRGKDFTHMGINCVSGLNVMCVLRGANISLSYLTWFYVSMKVR